MKSYYLNDVMLIVSEFFKDKILPILCDLLQFGALELVKCGRDLIHLNGFFGELYIGMSW